MLRDKINIYQPENPADIDYNPCDPEETSTPVFTEEELEAIHQRLRVQLNDAPKI